MQDLSNLLRSTGPGERLRLVWFALCGALAFLIGFVVVSPEGAKFLIRHGGYYYILGVFALFVFYAWRVAKARCAVWNGWLRRPGVAGIAIAAATAIALWIDPFKHKVLFDEYVLQGTAFHLHATKEVGAIYRAYHIAGTWLPIDTFLDKRPYFFAFLVSLVHDLTGYRVANMFALNVALTPVLLGLVYWLARVFSGQRNAAILALALLVSMPLLGQQSSGAGMELHNLTMLALVTALGVLYVRQPDADRLVLLVLGAILLSQSRYESVIFVIPTAIVIVAGWLRAGRVLLPWPALVAPLLLVPYAWHNRVLSATPALWQLNEGQTARFSLQYLPGNLEGAWKFFFNRTPELANSGWLSVMGAAAAGWLLWRLWHWARNPLRGAVEPGALVVAIFGAGIVGNLAMLMFYYWSRLDEVIASRFALPVCFLLAIFSARFVQDMEERRLPAYRLALLGLGVWLCVWGFPAIARRAYTDQNLVMQEIEWEHSFVLSRSGPLLLVTNKSSIPFVLWRIPSLIGEVARNRGEQISYHLSEGTFKEVLITQALRPTTPEGDRGIDPEDAMPDNFRLEPLVEKRFGGRWVRISRVTAIDPIAPRSTP